MKYTKTRSKNDCGNRSTLCQAPKLLVVSCRPGQYSSHQSDICSTLSMIPPPIHHSPLASYTTATCPGDTAFSGLRNVIFTFPLLLFMNQFQKGRYRGEVAYRDTKAGMQGDLCLILTSAFMGELGSWRAAGGEGHIHVKLLVVKELA